MFLTRNAYKKIWILTVLYLVLGTVSMALALPGIYFNPSEPIETGCKILFVLSIACFVLAPIVHFAGRYGEGKAKLFNSGRQLVLFRLHPAEFTEQYLAARNNPENAVSKPGVDILQLVACAYDALDESERALEAIDEMLSLVPDKRKPAIKLLKASVLFGMKRTGEAEALLSEVQNNKLDFQSRALLDVIYKSDRAKAYGDWNTLENYCKQKLLTTFPKNTPLVLLYTHYDLAEACRASGRINEARTHYEYCAANGGQTAVKAHSEKKLRELSSGNINE